MPGRTAIQAKSYVMVRDTILLPSIVRSLLLKYVIKTAAFLMAQSVALTITALPTASAVKVIAVFPLGHNVAKAVAIVRQNMNVAFLIAHHLEQCVALTAIGALLEMNALSTTAMATTIAVQTPIVRHTSN